MKLVGYKQAAEFPDVKVGTLYAWVHEHRVPHVRLSGRSVRFDLDELERWAKQRTRPAGSRGRGRFSLEE